MFRLFWKQMSIILGTFSTIIANRFLSKELWVPFFNLVGFVLGTYVNFLNKKKRKGPANDKKDLHLKSTIGHSKPSSEEQNNEQYPRQQ
jgi:hypothetical protein